MTPNLCGQGGTCVNTPGAYKCTCAQGYLYDLRTKMCMKGPGLHARSIGCHSQDASSHLMLLSSIMVELDVVGRLV